jgi:hypothetical protein
MEAGGNGYAMDADILGVRGGAERPRESARVGIACARMLGLESTVVRRVVLSLVKLSSGADA